MQYTVKGIDADGNRVTHTVERPDLFELMTWLGERGVEPIEVRDMLGQVVYPLRVKWPLPTIFFLLLLLLGLVMAMVWIFSAAGKSSGPKRDAGVDSADVLIEQILRD